MRRLLLTLIAFPTLAFAGAPLGMQEVGSASLHKLMLPVYDATLYAPGGEYDPDKRYALELTYHMNFKSQEIVGRTLDEMRQEQPVSTLQAAAWRAELAKVIPDVKKGDRIRALATPNHSLVFTHNDRITGVVTDPALVEPFMAIWLGDKTSEPDLRAHLLGQSAG